MHRLSKAALVKVLKVPGGISAEQSEKESALFPLAVVVSLAGRTRIRVYSVF